MNRHENIPLWLIASMMAFQMNWRVAGWIFMLNAGLTVALGLLDVIIGFIKDRKNEIHH